MKKSTIKNLVGVLGFLFGVMVMFSFAYMNTEPWTIPAKYNKMKNPIKGDAGSLTLGKQLYNKHCASCHGKNGVGDGKKASELKTDMPDLTRKAYKSQADGVKYYQSIIGRDEMPNYEKKIADEEERWAVINYMDTFK